MSKLANNAPREQIERDNWLLQQSIKRSYQTEVVDKIQALSGELEVVQYGSLSIDPSKYSLYFLKSRHWNPENRTVLVTGGVHGYETSGVQGAIRFLQNKITDYSNDFNFIVFPCISPWGYETINRWNPYTIDPNRSFYENSPSEEAKFVLEAITNLTNGVNEAVDLNAHFDLHETTDTDNSIFRPALASRDNVEQDNWNIPDGFYLVGDTLRPEAEFQKAMIEQVQKVTHIAPADDSGRIIGEKLEQFGVINYPTKRLGLCAGLSDAKYVTTTEVYPDSPKVDDEECILAQVASIVGGLNYIKSHD